MRIYSKNYYVYIMSSTCNAVLYIGVTNNILRRAFEHRTKAIIGFTSSYNVKKLVYYEATENVLSAIAREKQLKNWARAKKKKLIESINPFWVDLSEMLLPEPPNRSLGSPTRSG